MSKARSPRDVCSTTIGIRGLIWRSLYRRGPAGLRSLVAWRPQFARWFVVALVGALGREDLLRRVGFLGEVLGLRERDRFRRLADQLDRFLRQQVLFDHRV